MVQLIPVDDDDDTVVATLRPAIHGPGKLRPQSKTAIVSNSHLHCPSQSSDADQAGAGVLHDIHVNLAKQPASALRCQSSIHPAFTQPQSAEEAMAIAKERGRQVRVAVAAGEGDDDDDGDDDDG